MSLNITQNTSKIAHPVDGATLQYVGGTVKELAVSPNLIAALAAFEGKQFAATLDAVGSQTLADVRTRDVTNGLV